MSGFAILLGLSLKPLGLGADFNSASTAASFEGGHRAKSATSPPNTACPKGFLRYLVAGFAILLGLSLKPLGLGVEFNSASNGASFQGGIGQKVPLVLKIQVFKRVGEGIYWQDSLYYLGYL